MKLRQYLTCICGDDQSKPPKQSQESRVELLPTTPDERGECVTYVNQMYLKMKYDMEAVCDLWSFNYIYMTKMSCTPISGFVEYVIAFLNKHIQHLKHECIMHNDACLFFNEGLDDFDM